MRYELSDCEWAWWPVIVSPIHTLMPPSQKVSAMALSRSFFTPSIDQADTVRRVSRTLETMARQLG